jgi:hypothetical protein
MEPRGSVLAACRVGCVGVLAALLGCAGARAVEPGLANAPSLPPETASLPGIHDAVANGHDSCPRARVAAGDPLPYRFPACAGGETRAVVPDLLVAAPAPPAPPSLWNVRLHGLPPCNGPNERSKELAMAVCASD